MAESVSNSSVDSIPIQIVNNTDRPSVTMRSNAQIFDFPPGFASFVTTVTKHLAAKSTQEKLYLDNIESKGLSLLQFVPLAINSGSRSSVPPLEDRAFGVCRINSPWIDLAIERSPVPFVRGIVRYNERQLLTDQAILDGVSNIPLGQAIPLTNDEFNRYADLEYAPSEIRRQPALKPIEERVPPDLLWLFRRAWQDSPGLFFGPAGASMRKAMETGAEGYTQIVIALIDQCFAYEGAYIHYNSILDVADLVSIDQYKIITPIIVKPVRSVSRNLMNYDEIPPSQKKTVVEVENDSVGSFVNGRFAGIRRNKHG